VSRVDAATARNEACHAGTACRLRAVLILVCLWAIPVTGILAGCTGGTGVYIPIPLPGGSGVGDDDFVFDPPPTQDSGVATIAGDVVDATDAGQPVAGAYVRIAPRAGLRSLIRQDDLPSTYSAGDGSYTLTDVPAGDYAIAVEPPAGSGYASTRIEVEIRGGASVSLRVTMAPGELVGRIASVVLDPPDQTIEPTGTQRYTATVLDALGEVVPVLPTWVVTNNVGAINSMGLFTAGNRQAAGTVIASIGGHVGSTPVRVALAGNELPSVALQAAPQVGPAPLSVDVSASATDDGRVTAVQIDWGDGEWFESNAFPQTATHTYTAAGSYWVRARALDDQGAEGIAVAPVVVAADAAGAPTAELTATPIEGLAPLDVTFSGSGDDPNGTVVLWTLDFGDGAAFWMGPDPPQGIQHAYPAAGTYEARFVVQDDSGLFGYDIALISVSSGGNHPPTCSLVATPETGPAPLRVSFTGSASDPDGAIVRYALDFQGDGVEDWSDTVAPTALEYMYAGAGTFSPRLTVTDDGGAKATSTRVITAQQGPELAVSTSLLSFPLGSSSDSFNVRNTGQGSLNWSAAPSEAWIGVSPTTGTDDTTLTVTVDRPSLPVGGTQVGSVAISSNGGTATVIVRVDTEGAQLSVDPPLLDFARSESLLSFSIRNVGAGELNWTATSSEPWLALNVMSGVNDATVTATVDRTGLSAGVHVAMIHVVSAGGSATVSARVESASPVAIAIYPSSLYMAVGVTSAVLAVENVGDEPLVWSCAASEPWVLLSPMSGTNSGDVTVIVDRSSLTDGVHAAVVSFGSSEGVVQVPVQVQVPPGDATVIVK